MTWSDDSIAGGAGNVAYVTSKNAVLGLTRTAAVDGGERGIRVNAVCPGAVEGRMMRSIDDQRLSTTAAPARNPLCRRAHPEEIADTVAFLLSEQAGFITGEALVVDGGKRAQPQETWVTDAASRRPHAPGPAWNRPISNTPKAAKPNAGAGCSPGFAQ
jgi:NAD(P)-dependent dehydrogenase (short-subunit alcohol dehydrogenase family)